MVNDNEADEKQPTAVLAFNDKKKSTSPAAPAAAADNKSEKDGTKDKEDCEQQPEATFPQQLMDAIEAETLDENAPRVNGERVIEWTAKGESFIIRDKKALERQVLPRYFTAKCKYMSFVRKLYRWGFRQIEKNVSGIMIFTHQNFHRGDKQRCLMMRSIVRKRDTASNMAQDQGGMANQQSAAAAALQNFGMMNNMNALMGGGSNNQFGSMNLSAFNQMGGLGMNMGMNSNNGGGMGNSNGMGFGGMFNSMPSQFPQGLSGQQGMTSNDMFEARLRLEHMQMELQKRQQLMNTNNNSLSPIQVGSSLTNTSQSMGMGAINQGATNVGSGNNNENSNFVGGQGNNISGGNPNPVAAMSEIDLASELMKRDPQMKPWKAFELAKAFKQQSN